MYMYMNVCQRIRCLEGGEASLQCDGQHRVSVELEEVEVLLSKLLYYAFPARRRE